VKTFNKVTQKKKSRSNEAENRVKEDLLKIQEKLELIKNPVVNVENNVTHRMGIL
jgi:hypothetical protein